MFRRSQLITVRIVLLDETTLDVTLKDNVFGSSLLNAVASELNIRERQYFGIKYLSVDNVSCWLQLKQSLSRQMSHTSTAYFAVKFFLDQPNRYEDELTRYYVTQQVRRALRQGLLVVSDRSKLLFLFALLAQSEFGDYSSVNHRAGYLMAIMGGSGDDEAASMVTERHKRLRGQQPVDVERRFLDEVRWLPLYGGELYAARDLRCVESDHCYLVVLPLSISFFKRSQITQTYYWARIRRIQRKDCTIKISYKDSVSGDVPSFEIASKTAAKQLVAYAEDYIAFTRQRHKATDSVIAVKKNSNNGGGTESRHMPTSYSAYSTDFLTQRKLRNLGGDTLMTRSQMDLSHNHGDSNDEEIYITAKRQDEFYPLSSTRFSRSTTWLNQIDDRQGLFSQNKGNKDDQLMMSLKFKHSTGDLNNYSVDHRQQEPHYASNSHLDYPGSHATYHYLPPHAASNHQGSLFGRLPKPPDPLIRQCQTQPLSTKHHRSSNRVSFHVPSSTTEYVGNLKNEIEIPSQKNEQKCADEEAAAAISRNGSGGFSSTSSAAFGAVSAYFEYVSSRDSPDCDIITNV